MTEPSQNPIIEAIVEVLDTYSTRIAAAYLFGSEAAGTAGPESDIDVAVLWTGPGSDTRSSTLRGGTLTLEGDIELALRRRVQVVDLKCAPIDLAIRVLRGGELIWERDRSARIRFEVATRNTYFDLEPILQRCRRVG